jgi:selenocysteine lyase/cysteine desulfurase
MTRREFVGVTAAIPLSAGAAGASTTALPDKASFVARDDVYLDSGSMHPVSKAVKGAINTYLSKRTGDPASKNFKLDEDGVRAKFAQLINASPDEIAYVQSTTTAEHLILRALGLPAKGAHIVTDTLHFFGSFPLYEEMAKQGCEVTWLRPVEGRISVEAYEKAIRKDTKLVALSLVSTFNGYEHDLKRICEIAHARGALVYADIVHAAGCVPVDVKASGVDFAATSSYKWLMGDFGLGFLYARKDRLGQLQRTQEGYYGMSAFTPHVYPFDAPGESIADYTFEDSAMGHFAFGTYSHMGVAALSASLDYILTLGVERIQAHAEPLITRLKQELPRLGYSLVTPMETRTPLVTCALENATTVIGPKLKAANVRTTVSRNRFRASISVFNDMEDVNRLLKALA